MADSQETIQNYLESQSEENKSTLFYGDEEGKDKSIIISENSRNTLSLRNTIQSEICYRPENYSNVHFFCNNCLSIPIIEFIDILNIILLVDVVKIVKPIL
jgi:hypothetical protein